MKAGAGGSTGGRRRQSHDLLAALHDAQPHGAVITPDGSELTADALSQSTHPPLAAPVGGYQRRVLTARRGPAENDRRLCPAGQARIDARAAVGSLSAISSLQYCRTRVVLHTRPRQIVSRRCRTAVVGVQDGDGLGMGVSGCLLSCGPAGRKR